MSAGPPQRWTRVIDETEELSEMYGALSEQIMLQDIEARADAMRTARNGRHTPRGGDRSTGAGRRWWRKVAHRAR